jgi:ankyrin repeat protein
VPYGHTATVQALLEAGADYQRKSAPGDTPMRLAITGGHREVIELLWARAMQSKATS